MRSREPFRPSRRAAAGRGVAAAARPANPMGDSKADTNVAPVKIGDTIAKTDFAVKPKELSDAVKKGLEYLVKGQQEDGGWNQGGGWRNNTGGGRVEGKTSKTPPTSATPASSCWRSSGPATPRPRASTRTP